MGERAAVFGRQEATHRGRFSGRFMGIATTGMRVTIRYMDFWRVVNDRITDNWVMVDVEDVRRQLGRDPFVGEGWEAFDRGAAVPPQPPSPSPSRSPG